MGARIEGPKADRQLRAADLQRADISGGRGHRRDLILSGLSERPRRTAGSLTEQSLRGLHLGCVHMSHGRLDLN
ncbi:hypothetical protein EV291_105125 [Rhizobium sp. BK068]|nr:hypothetical protein [Rhizobium sp. BK060]TCM78503.1 hypothetical protein EV291_105125 [Rhizobium sp. BK068]